MENFPHNPDQPDNRRPQQPNHPRRYLDEPPLDPHPEDPLSLLEREEHRQSLRQAIIFFLSIPAAAIISSITIAVISSQAGGPFCERDASAHLCSRTFEWLFYVIPGVICFAGVFGAALICYFKWRHHRHWRPWIAVIWFLMPIALGWMTNSGAMLMLR